MGDVGFYLKKTSIAVHKLFNLKDYKSIQALTSFLLTASYTAHFLEQLLPSLSFLGSHYSDLCSSQISFISASSAVSGKVTRKSERGSLLAEGCPNEQ